MPGNEETLEMLDYGIDMLTGELPLSEQEYGWTPELQADIRGRLERIRTAVVAGEVPATEEMLETLDAAGVKEGTLREFCALVS